MSVSKTVFKKIFEHEKCSVLFHPWNESCLCGNLELFYSSAIGTNKFYNLYYLIELYLNRKNLSKEYLKYLLKGVIQSTLFGCFMATGFVSCNCIFRKVMGKWHYYTTLFTASIGGLAVFVDNPKRRGLSIATFVNMILELSLNQLRDWKLLTKNRNIEVFPFMVFSAIFMYYLRTDHAIIQTGGPHIWFYTPPPFPYIRKESKTNSYKKQRTEICPHEGVCWKNILKTAMKYFGIGIAFEILHIVMRHGSKMSTSPSLVVKLIFKTQNTRFGLFLASYLFIYKAVSCILCHYQGFDSPLNALPAGFLAGLAYIIQPNQTMLTTIVSNLIMAEGRHLCDKLQLPNLPYGELFVALSNGLLYHYRIFHAQCCPEFMINMMDTCTNKKSAIIYKMFYEKTQKHLEAFIKGRLE